MSVTLINVFEVPADRDEEFLASWQAAADHVATQPGYISTRLHRAMTPDARFRFVNVAEYASPEDFRAVAASPSFRELASRMSEFSSSPALYTAVREHHR